MTAPTLHSNTTQPTQLMANAIRVLVMDTIQQANSGHSGAPMGMAGITVTLWSRHLRHNPLNPRWPDRDRLVLSNSHGLMLIYALLHLTGYDLPMSELKDFRQLHSKTAGHLEYGITPGMETTTGPLDQGTTDTIDMALTGRLLGREFNRPDFDVVNHHIYVFLGDDYLMEGISRETCSLASILKLNKLIALWDDSGISIDGDVVHWFSDDTPRRSRTYGWSMIHTVDGHNVNAVDAAITEAKKSDKPTLICYHTLIGEGAPNKEGGHDVYDAPLGGVKIAAAREALAWPHAPFEVPQAVYDTWDAKGQGQALEKAWSALFDAYSGRYPAEAKQFERRMHGGSSAGFEKAVDEFIEKCELGTEAITIRRASQNTLEAYAPVLDELLGGSAGLTGSNLANWSGSKAMRMDAWGNHTNYGVREFGMGAIINGIALYGGYIPYGGTFLTFSDYSRNALCMAALMEIRSIFAFTHDSVGLGEDGPAHQSIERVTSLRLIPSMDIWRITDTTETAVAWAVVVERQNDPSCLILSRQNLPFRARDLATREAITHSGYMLRDTANGKPGVVVIVAGSEVGLAADAADQLTARRIHARVVLVLVATVFDEQDSAYKASMLPVGIPRIAVEADVTGFQWKYQVQAVVGIDTSDESAPAGALFKHFDFTVGNVMDTAESVIA